MVVVVVGGYRDMGKIEAGRGWAVREVQEEREGGRERWRVNLSFRKLY